MYKYILKLIGWILNKKVIVLEDFEYEKYYCLEDFTLHGQRIFKPLFYGQLKLFCLDDESVITILGHSSYIKRWKYFN